MIPTLIVAGIQIPFSAMHDVTQSLRQVGGTSRDRMEDGSLVAQYSWTKWRYQVSARGVLRPGLDALNDYTEYEVSTADWQDVTSTSRVIALPSARRSDTGHTPRGFAFVPGNPTALEVVSTNLVLAGDSATLDAVAGAQHYIAQWLPKFTALITFERERIRNSAEVNWTLTAEEV